MKRFFLAALLVTLGASQVFANVFAAHLKQINNGNGTFTLQYRLSENADSGVTVKIKNGATVVKTIAAGAQTSGSKSVVWDGTNDASNPAGNGTYTWEVTASDDGYSTFTQISSDANIATKFYTPYGVAVNNDVTSPRFGTAYVVNGVVGSSSATTLVAARACTDGVYVLSNDQTDITSQGNTAYGGSVAWGGSASPFRCRFDEQDNLFITDWSDPNSGIWIMNTATPSAAFSELFGNSSTRDGNGRVGNLHGSVSCCAVIGTGAARTLYTLDEDLTATAASQQGSMYKYAIGNTSTGYVTAPVTEVDDAAMGNLNQNYNVSIAQANGGWWLCQYRSSDSATIPSLYHIKSGTTPSVDFKSFTSNYKLNSSTQSAMAINPAKTRLAVVGIPGTATTTGLQVFDISNADPNAISHLYSGTITGTTSRDAAFDAAGNVYLVNSSSEYMKVFSPPGANSFTTPAPSTESITLTGSGVGEWLAY